METNKVLESQKKDNESKLIVDEKHLDLHELEQARLTRTQYVDGSDMTKYNCTKY